MSGNRVFISCVSDEFEKVGSPFAGLRTDLHLYISRAKVDVRVQEYFAQSPDDTVQKLADEVRDSAAVVHLVGEKVGALAHPKAVADFLAATPDFIAKHPDLRKDLGDCAALSYTQWEAFLALHYGIPLFVYATEAGLKAQKEHLTRLKGARRYASGFTGHVDLFGQLIGDLHEIIAAIPKFTRQIAPSRIFRHAARVLFGREKELAALDAAWAKPSLNVYTLVAWGGAGKTSLVAHWVSDRLAKKGWPGVDRYFDWSFYSQGTGESRQTSSDLFIQAALTFFDDPDPTKGSPWERGERLANLASKHRTLLILDGLEPLQYPPNDKAMPGRLKDQALQALLQSLAHDNPGLCVVTTRETLKDLEPHATTEEQKLDKLAKEAAVGLLRHLQIVGTDEELHAAWKDAGGHALTLQLLGRFIADAYTDKDIRHYKAVKFEEADLDTQGRSAFKVMIAYERWLASAGPAEQRQLALLRLTGLFDRPMSRDCLDVLRRWTIQPFWRRMFKRRDRQFARLFASLASMSEKTVNIALSTLSNVDLLTLSPDAIDAHPLIREYFASQLKTQQPEAFKSAHSRLFDHLCATAPERTKIDQATLLKIWQGYDPTPADQLPTLDDLAPLYQAIVHGCFAGRHRKACEKVYCDRILRGTGSAGYYSTNKLGASGADLAAVAAFFDVLWTRVSPNLSEAAQAWLLNEAALGLRALGRLTEALQPMRAGLELTVRQKDWTNAAIRASNLSELQVTVGELQSIRPDLPDAVANARHSVVYAEKSGDAFERMSARTTAADALHQAGQRAEAGALFAVAERIQKERQPGYDLLYSLAGFRYCYWMLAVPELAAWRALLDSVGRTGVPPVVSTTKTDIKENSRDDPATTVLKEVERRALTTIKWGAGQASLLCIALDHLTLARTAVLRVILTGPLLQPALSLPQVADAVNGLREAGQMQEVPNGLLTASLYHFVRGEHDLARQNLAEAQQIAERGPMPLFLADVHLHRARMFRDQDELVKAAKLIRDLGYGRRSDELADAEEAAKNW